MCANGSSFVQMPQICMLLAFMIAQSHVWCSGRSNRLDYQTFSDALRNLNILSFLEVAMLADDLSLLSRTLQPPPPKSKLKYRVRIEHLVKCYPWDNMSGKTLWCRLMRACVNWVKQDSYYRDTSCRRPRGPVPCFHAPTPLDRLPQNGFQRDVTSDILLRSKSSTAWVAILCAETAVKETNETGGTRDSGQ